MGWQEIKALAKDVVHATFKVPATYYAPGSSTPIDVTVRHHMRTMVFGDLDREGFGQQIEDINRLILDTDEITPAANGKVVLGNGDELYLEVMERQDASRYQVWNVIRKSVRS